MVTMLLATPGQTASYVCHAPASVNGSNNNSSINSNHTKALSSAHKLGRTTYKLIESSQNNTASSTTTTTTQAGVLMKTIAVRGNRSSGFHSATQSAPASNNKSNGNVNINDNVVNCVKKVIALTATTTNNSNASKGSAKATSSALASSNTSNAKAVTTANAATTSSSSSSSSSASAKIVLSASFLKTFTVPPTDLHRSSVARSRSYSIDSLYDEMCHFKPIRSVPTTPWKCGSKSRGATIKAPIARMGQKTSNCDVDLKKSRNRKDLKRECSKAKTKIKPKLSANLFPHLKPHPSAFVRLLLPMGSYTIPSSTQRICKRLQSLKQTENDLESKETSKTTKGRLKSKRVNKQGKKTQQKKEPVTVNPRLSNTKKRKAQTKPKKSESTASKKPKIDTVNRKTPPLTRRRIRMDENCKLYGPLA